MRLHIWSMTFDDDILIAGGGLNGLTMAIALSSAGFQVALSDPTSRKTMKSKGFDGRGYALAVSSMRVLKTLGVWERLPDPQPILNIKVTDGRAGEGPSPLMLAFDHAEIEEGPMGYMVEDRHLRPALLDTVHDAGTTELEDPVINHKVGAAGVEINVGEKVRTARMLIACDGKNSAIAMRSGINRHGWGYDQTALVCAVTHEKPHHGTAHQFFMPAGPLAILPLRDNRSSIVWTESSDRAAVIQALGDESYLAELRPRFGSFLGEISLSGERFTYPLALSVADRFASPRIALVGDAAHVVHPIAGQGLNAGLKDVAALAEVLTDARRRGEDIGQIDVLQRYETWRRFDTTTLAAATDGFNRLFSNDNPLARVLRDIGLGLTNALPGLRRRLIREAAGLTGDLPRLAQGKPL